MPRARFLLSSDPIPEIGPNGSRSQFSPLVSSGIRRFSFLSRAVGFLRIFGAISSFFFFDSNVTEKRGKKVAELCISRSPRNPYIIL